MSAGKWSITRYENGLWCIWDGDGHHRITYSTWEEAMRDAYRVAAIIWARGQLFTADAVARELADAGLLAPGPVPPSYSEDRSPQWFYLGDQIVATSGCGDIGIQHTVVIDDEDGSPVHSERWIDLTPEDARHLAAILLTAAAHATQEKK